MNKTVKIIVSIVVSVWIFAMGLEIGAFRERKAINVTISGGNNPTQSSTTPTAPPPVTQTPTAPSTQPTQNTTQTPSSPQNDPTQGTTQPSENEATTKAPSGGLTVPKTNEEIAKAFNDAINNTKHTTKNCKAIKDVNIKIQVVDCSVGSLTGAVNAIAQKFTEPEHLEYNFVAGKDGEVSIYSDLPTSGKDVSLAAAGISQAKAEPYGNGGYKLSITIVPETGSLDTPPTHHASSVGYLDLASLDLGKAKITEANFSYSGATVELCVNSDGLIDTYHCVLPMSGTGVGKLGLSASATIDGSSTEDWTFTWA